MTERLDFCGPDDFLNLERHAVETPSAIALAGPGSPPLSYRLIGRLNAARNQLAGTGFGRGDVAALVLPNGPELITAFLAISGIGACAPLNPALPEDEYRWYLSRLGARAVIVMDGMVSPVKAAQSLGMQVLRMHRAPEVKPSVFTQDEPAHKPTAAGRRTDAALLLFTSATTGAPKLVPLTGRNLSAMAARDRRALELSEGDRLLSFMPLFHLLGLCSVLTQLFCGGTVIGTPGFNPTAFLAWVDEFQPTWFTSNAPVNRAILTLAREHPEVFRRAPLRLIRSSGRVTEPEVLTLLEDAAGAPVLNGYGLTETGGVTRSTRDARKPGSAGRTSGLEVGVMDRNGDLQPAETDGEIVVRGPSVTSGYLDDPGANKAAFRDGWFHTGDIGHLDGEGFLFITGRLKEMIDRGGEKIIPEEVDAALAAHPALSEAAAFSVAHRTLGEDIAAAVVLRDGASASEPDLRRFLAARLARYKVPRRIVFVDRIPRTATGKPKRAALAEQFRDLMLPPAEAELRAPDGVQGQLTEIWRRIMDRTERR